MFRHKNRILVTERNSPMLTNLTLKKKIIIIVIAVIVVAGITIGTVFLFKSLRGDNTSQNKITTSQENADNLKDQAIEALKNNSTNEAKTLFQQAKQQYEDLNDKNNVVDMEAQLYLIEHQYTPSP